MPVIHTYSSTPIPAAARESLKTTYGKAIEAVPGKSEQWLMCLFEENVPSYHAGTDDAPVAYVTVDVFAREAVRRSAWEQMTPTICDALKKYQVWRDGQLWLERHELLVTSLCLWTRCGIGPLCGPILFRPKCGRTCCSTRP